MTNSAEAKVQGKGEREPLGFSEHTRRSSSEHAHEQGWGLNEDERRKLPRNQAAQGGTDYDYGARDFGDTAADTSAAQPSGNMLTMKKGSGTAEEATRGQRPPDQRTSARRG